MRHERSVNVFLRYYHFTTLHYLTVLYKWLPLIRELTNKNMTRSLTGLHANKLIPQVVYSIKIEIGFSKQWFFYVNKLNPWSVK